MPGKVNPVIPEAVSQAALLVFGYDAAIATAAGLGSLELNAFLPLVAACLLQSLSLLASGDELLRRLCVEGIEADEERCAAHVHASTTAATALVPEIGYEAACDVVRRAQERGATIRDVVVADGLLSAARYDELLTAEAVCRLGTPARRGGSVDD
jgi:aspartate ammonia-lyase